MACGTAHSTVQHLLYPYHIQCIGPLVCPLSTMGEFLTQTVNPLFVLSHAYISTIGFNPESGIRNHVAFCAVSFVGNSYIMFEKNNLAGAELTVTFSVAHLARSALR